LNVTEKKADKKKESQGTVDLLQADNKKLQKTVDKLEFKLAHADIFHDCITKLVGEAPSVLAVQANPLLYGEFLHALRRSLT
jgi:hypothetical protein